MRERRISIAGLQLAVALPDELADRVARSPIYQNVIRPSTDWMWQRPTTDFAAGPPAPPVDLSPWYPPKLLEHPDGQIRHRRLAGAVRRSYPQGGTVLSVGDPTFSMGDSLTGFDITYTDVIAPLRSPPKGARFVQADFCERSSFDGASFDVVCSVDVLEHIPRESRRSFIGNALRVARRAAFLSFPANEDARVAESLLLRSRSRTAFRDALEDHARHGLPDVIEVEAILDDFGAEYVVSAHTSLAEWLTSFVLCPTDFEEGDLVMDYWRFLSRTAAAEPGHGPTYRYLFEVRQ